MAYVRNIPVQDVECDEIWAYVGKRDGHKTEEEATEALAMLLTHLQNSCKSAVLWPLKCSDFK